MAFSPPFPIAVSFLCRWLLCLGRNGHTFVSFLCCLFPLSVFSQLLSPLLFHLDCMILFLRRLFLCLPTYTPVGHLSIDHTPFSVLLSFGFFSQGNSLLTILFKKSSHSNICTKNLGILHVLVMAGRKLGLEFVSLLDKTWGRCSEAFHSAAIVILSLFQKGRRAFN